MWAVIIIVAIIVATDPVPGRDLQRHGPRAQPRRRGLERDRRPAQAPARPDPEPGRDRQGLRGARGRRLRGRHAGARQRHERAAGPGAQVAAGRGPAERRARPPLRRRRGLPAAARDRELPAAAGRAHEHRGSDRRRAPHLQRQRAGYNTRIQTFPAAVFAGMFGFAKREFFEIDSPADREAPSVSFGSDSAPPAVDAARGESAAAGTRARTRGHAAGTRRGPQST